MRKLAAGGLSFFHDEVRKSKIFARACLCPASMLLLEPIDSFSLSLPHFHFLQQRQRSAAQAPRARALNVTRFYRWLTTN
jgi:hypothetical protein